VGATVTKFQVDYKEIEVSATVDSNGKPTSVTISYVLEAELAAKVAIMKAEGNGKAKTVIKYSNFN
jgi:hypothetical protein